MPIPNYASATYPLQSEPDSVDFEIISAAHNGYGVASGCACTPGNSGVNLSVAVASGSVHVGSVTAVAVTGATVTPGAASGANPRFDLVVADNAGALSVVAGTAAAAPVFPAIPASRTVLCAVWIPTSATSITAANIVDKRQMVNYVPEFGTTSTTTARGDHLHSGEYASTEHADTHASGGSDEITTLGAHDVTGGLALTSDAGNGYIQLPAQDVAAPAVAPDDHKVRLFAEWIAWKPYPAVASADRLGAFGSTIVGFPGLWLVTPGQGTTLASGLSNTFGPAYAGTGTLSHPSPTTALGYRAQLATASSANATASISSNNVFWCRGDSALPWLGYLFHARIAFPDASYANTGASTGVRIFIGLTADSVANALGSDTPTGVRHGFQLVHVNGGKTQTQFQMTVRDGTAESLTSSGISITQNHVYDFFIHIRPNGGYPFGMVRDLTAGTSSGSLIDTTRSPTNTTFMRAMVGLQTINATARAWQFHRIGIEVPA